MRQREAQPSRWNWTQLSGMLTGLAAIGALFFTALSLHATRDQIGVLEQDQLTNRFSKAVEQLGNKDNIEIRLGGIYALERIARDSPRDHPTVIEVLSAYIREHAPIATCTEQIARPTTDVQAVLTVIGRRNAQQDRGPPDLSDTCLTYADLPNANLTGANLTDAYLPNANLTGAYLTRTNLTDAQLAGADLTNAHGLGL